MWTYPFFGNSAQKALNEASPDAVSILQLSAIAAIFVGSYAAGL